MDPSLTALVAELGLGMLTIFALVVLGLLLSSYVKIVTILGILRVGMGVSSVPSAFVAGGLAIALSFFVMYPTLTDATKAMNDNLPRTGRSLSDVEKARVLELGFAEWKEFLIIQTHPAEKSRFLEIAKRTDRKRANEAKAASAVVEPNENDWRILVPAFFVSELREAFMTGLSLFLPFLIIDLLVANVLVAVGLNGLSPLAVSFPFKLLLFVMVDGWSLITGNIVASYS